MPRCTICDTESVLLYGGTVDPRSFFVREQAYAITEFSTHERLDVWQCRKCGLGFSPNDLSQEEVSFFYAHQPIDKEYCMEEEGRRKTFKNILKRIETYCPARGTLLDIGSGPGFFLDEAQRRGWKVNGCESSEEARSYCKKNFGVESIQYEDIESLPNNVYNVITMFDVIEHVKSPQDFLRSISKKLVAGGLVVLITPRFESLTRKILKKKWYFIFPAHLWYFTSVSLSQLLANTYFEIVSSRLHVFHFSVRYYLLRLSAFVPFFSRIAVGSAILPYSLGEELEVYAKKK